MNGIEKQWNTRQHNTAGLELHYKHTKNLFADDSEGLRLFRDHRWKALGEEKPDLPGIFSVIAKKNRQIWIRLVKYSTAGLPISGTNTNN